MRRRPLLAVAALAALASLVLGGCASSSTRLSRASAATVNGAPISSDDVFAQLDAIASVPAYGGAFNLDSQVSGTSPGTWDTSAAAAVLNTLVLFELVEQEVDDRGIEVTADDVDLAQQQVASLLGSLGPLGQTDEEFGAEQADQVPASVRNRFSAGLAAYQALQDEVALDVEPEEVTDAEVRAFYDENPDAVAGLAFEDVESEIRQALEGQAEEAARRAALQPFDEWLRGALLGADVEVDPRFGRWTYVLQGPTGLDEVAPDEAEAAVVLPPAGPAAPTQG